MDDGADRVPQSLVENDVRVDPGVSAERYQSGAAPGVRDVFKRRGH